MTDGWADFGGPRPRDLARLVLARASSRLSLDRATDELANAVTAVFQRELQATVRSITPLLPAICAHLGVDLDDLLQHIRPAPGWPKRARLPMSNIPGPLGRQRSAGARGDSAWRARLAAFSPDQCPALIVEAPGDHRLLIHVVDHSIEVAAALGPVRVRSLFGGFRLVVPHDEEFFVAPPQKGEGIDALVEHPGLQGHGWRVASVDAPSGYAEHRISVRTGSCAFSLSGAR